MLRICGWLAGALCFVAGCSSSDLNLVPVSGTVKLDGAPLANKSLMFAPESGQGPCASANTDTEGKYELLAIVNGITSDVKGAPPGKYKVTVFERAIPIQGAEGDEAMQGFLMPAEAVNGKGGVPLIYQDQATTPLRAEVPDGGGMIDLDLESRRR